MKSLLFCSIFLIALLCILYGTNSSRHKSRLSPVAAATIRNGMTTKMEVRALLGTPNEMLTQVPIRQPAGAPPLEAKYTASEIWEYGRNASGKADARAMASSYFVIVFFDERGVVLDCETEAR